MRWITELLGLPRSSAGGFVTGTTAAHTALLAAARDSLLERVGWNVSDGLFGAPPITVIVGAEGHSTQVRNWAQQQRQRPGSRGGPG